CSTVATPLPSSPTRQARASWNSTSLLPLLQSPSLSFSRCRRRPLRAPSGAKRGSRKQLSPPGACASTRKASHIGAEKNHLCPTRAYMPSPVGVATVVLACTSEPPCF